MSCHHRRSIPEDAISSVPRAYKEASLALGAARWQTLIRVVVPSALSGIIASVMLGMGRAIGETMTVLMATGNALKTPTHILEAVRTMTATQSESSSSRAGSIAGDYYMLGKVRTLDEIKKAIDKTSVDSVLNFLRENRFKDFTVVTIGPKEVKVG